MVNIMIIIHNHNRHIDVKQTLPSLPRVRYYTLIHGYSKIERKQSGLALYFHVCHFTVVDLKSRSGSSYATYPCDRTQKVTIHMSQYNNGKTASTIASTQ